MSRRTARRSPPRSPSRTGEGPPRPTSSTTRSCAAGRPGYRQLRADRLAAAAALPAGTIPARSTCRTRRGTRSSTACGRQSTQLVFFCQGVTCQMSPLSQRKAIALGYTNTRSITRAFPVGNQGLPRHPAAVRQGSLCRQGHPGDLPRRALERRERQRPPERRGQHAGGDGGKQAKSFPDPKLKAAIIVYDGRGGDEAKSAARALVKSGQSNVQVMEKACSAGSRRYVIESGAPAATKVAYVRSRGPLDPGRRVHQAGTGHAGPTC